jgi:site-specific DNA-cytosine methylase
MLKKKEILHFHGFCGLGSGAAGFNDGEAKVGNIEAKFRCLGGIDNDPAAVADFKTLTGVAATLLDLFTREQYIRWHGHEPPAGWRQAVPADIRKAAGNERPHIVFTSPPCKGFSGLLSEKKSASDKYQALNELTLRGIWLMLEAWSDDPPEFFLLENVPRIMNRGRYLLDQIIALLHSYGYATAETTHDCGELGGLAQTRRRFLLVARHQAKVPPFLYEPVKRPLRGVGEVLGKLPMPSDPIAGPMHRLPALHWKTWVRLAFVQAGSDWRSLNRLNVEDGYLRDYLLVPEMHRGALGVREWEQHGCTVTGTCRSYNGGHNVADPRFSGEAYGQYGVRKFDQHAVTVTSQRSPGQGPFSVADPRPNWKRYSNAYRVVRFDQNSPGVIAGGKGPQGGQLSVADPRAAAFSNGYGVLRYDSTAGAVSGESLPSNGRFAVADPRHAGPAKFSNEYHIQPWDRPAQATTSAHGKGQAVSDPRPPKGPLFSKYAVSRWDGKTGTVIGGDDQGAYAVADPRTGLSCENGHNYHKTGKHYGVVPWEGHSNAIAGSARQDNGYNSVADPRIPMCPICCAAAISAGHGVAGDVCQGCEFPGLPKANDRCTPVIIAEDNTWHRPFTTLELATLQSLIDPDEFMHQLGEEMRFAGNSDSAWRERIGNAVPRKAAKAIASVMGKTLLLAWSGETFVLDSMPIWVQPLVIAVTVDSFDNGAPV